MKHEPRKMQELREALANYRQPMAKIRRNGGAPHFSRAKLISIEGDKAIVQPLHRHRKLETYPIVDVVLWQSPTIDNESHLTFPTDKYAAMVSDLPEEAPADSEPSAPKKPVGSGDHTKEWLGQNGETVELILLDLFQGLDEKFRADILGKNAGYFLQRHVLNNKRNFREILEHLRHEADVPLSEKRVRKFFNNRSKGTDGRTAIVEIYPSFASRITKSQPTREVAPPPAEHTEAPVESPEPTAPVAAATKEIPVAEFQRAIRRVIRDHENLEDDEKYLIEAAVVGCPTVNERLDALDVDDRVAHLLSLQGMTTSGEAVRERRHNHWPSPPPAIDPAQAMRDALREGSLTRRDLIRALLETDNDCTTPSDLIAEIVRTDLPDQPPLPNI